MDILELRSVNTRFQIIRGTLYFDRSMSERFNKQMLGLLKHGVGLYTDQPYWSVGGGFSHWGWYEVIEGTKGSI